MKSVRCSFCGKSQSEVAKLISAPKSHGNGIICDGCVKVCASIMSGHDQEKVQIMPRSRVAAWLLRTFSIALQTDIQNDRLEFPAVAPVFPL